MEYVVETQGLENYGAHSESGKFADSTHYWKFKGGTNYIVSGLDRPQDAMAFIAAIGMENGIGWKEWPCQVQTLAEWEQQFDMNDPWDVQHHEFKLSIMKRVSPGEMIKSKKAA